MKGDASDRLLLRLALVTLGLFYLTSLAGSVVRATGSGMGCPDWPRCFGRLIPPTDVSQLPPDYKTRYQVEGKPIADFNPVHTWVEYVNRLVGAAGGLAMVATMLAAARIWRRDPPVPFLLLGALVTFGFVVWMGKEVVRTDLEPLNITIHMLGSLVLIAAAVSTTQRVRRRVGAMAPQRISKKQRTLLVLSLVAVLGQIVLGTRVREKVDHAAEALNDCCRDRWAENLGALLPWHQVGAWALVALLVYTFMELGKAPGGLTREFQRLRAALLLLPAGSYAVGVALMNFHFPVAAQPAHLLLPMLLFGAVVAILTGAVTEKSSPA